MDRISDTILLRPWDRIYVGPGLRPSGCVTQAGDIVGLFVGGGDGGHGIFRYGTKWPIFDDVLRPLDLVPITDYLQIPPPCLGYIIRPII